MTANKTNEDFVSINSNIKFGEILFICKSRAITLAQMCDKKKGTDPKLDLVNMNAYIKFGENQSIWSRDIRAETFFCVNQGP